MLVNISRIVYLYSNSANSFLFFFERFKLMGGVESHERLKNRSALISAREIAMKMPVNRFQLVRLYSNSVRFFARDLNWRGAEL